MHNFTPISALIGISSVLLLWLNGRIAGISGIFHGLFPPHKNDVLWRLLFLIGLILGGMIYYLFPSLQFTPREHFPIYLSITAGFLVGIGTKLCGGCTSGHGVCGLARLSKRSFAATGLFFAMGLLTTYVVRHIWLIS